MDATEIDEGKLNKQLLFYFFTQATFTQCQLTLGEQPEAVLQSQFLQSPHFISGVIGLSGAMD